MAAIGTLPVLLGTGTHASRPAATAVGAGGLWACSTHSLIYQTDGATWATWATLGGTETLPVTIIDAKGDLIAGTAADTAARVAAGANDTILMADSGQSAGLKWVASQTPTTQDYDDVAAEGTADTYARGDHLHGMPSAGGGGTTFKRTVLNGGGNITTTSTTKVAIDATNLAYLTLTLAVGDVVECGLFGAAKHSGSVNSGFDFEVDQPTSANTFVASGADYGVTKRPPSIEREPVAAVGMFTATESGSHGFRPAWLTDSGTLTLLNAASSDDDVLITFYVKLLGAPA